MCPSPCHPAARCVESSQVVQQTAQQHSWRMCRPARSGQQLLSQEPLAVLCLCVHRFHLCPLHIVIASQECLCVCCPVGSNCAQCARAGTYASMQCAPAASCFARALGCAHQPHHGRRQWQHRPSCMCLHACTAVLHCSMGCSGRVQLAMGYLGATWCYFGLTCQAQSPGVCDVAAHDPASGWCGCIANMFQVLLQHVRQDCPLLLPAARVSLVSTSPGGSSGQKPGQQ